MGPDLPGIEGNSKFAINSTANVRELIHQGKLSFITHYAREGQGGGLQVAEYYTIWFFYLSIYCLSCCMKQLDLDEKLIK